ncbi:MAG TPA: DegT/DnrJ/EryC1/StrS family aminotransferase [Patescibacteria group bacterium]|nr:DegT/DnrJ/EryC1/StrS family aminotransferase [Patescibacteria group bacterium]
MNVPFIDLQAQYKETRKSIDARLRAVLRRGDFILGKDVALFEKEFARLCGSRYSIGVSSGTAALFLALKAFDIGPGDEVIVPVFTFIATAFAVSYTGARPVFVDIRGDTFNIDPEKIPAALTARTKAILPVHLFGQAAEMSRIMEIAKQHDLKVIEDAAQAHGARLKMAGRAGTYAGNIGDAGCFSFYPTKNLGAFGDAGLITVNDEAAYKKLCVLRDCGRTGSRYEHGVVGYNSRLDTLQAAVLAAKLKRLKAWNAMRRQAAKAYDAYFNQVAGISVPYALPEAEHIYHAYVIRVARRDALLNYLKARHIGASVYYPLPLHLQGAYRDQGHARGDFPVAEKVAQEVISLPMYPHIRKAQIKYVADTVRKFLKE